VEIFNSHINPTTGFLSVG